MSYPLLILGLLVEKSCHAYEMKQQIQSRGMDQYIRLSGGGLHYHLGQLLASGHIEKQSIDREKNYPERQIYKITELGKMAFLDQLREALADLDGRRTYDPLDAALALSMPLEPKEVAVYLEYQASLLHPLVLRLKAIRSFVLPSLTSDISYAALVVDHSVHKKEAELAWLEKTIDLLREKNRLLPEEAYFSTPTAKQQWIKLMTILKGAGEGCRAKIQAAWHRYKYTNTQHGFSSTRKDFKDYRQSVSSAIDEYKQFIENQSAQPGLPLSGNDFENHRTSS